MRSLRTATFGPAPSAELYAEGFEIADEDAQRLSPLRHEHVNLLGRYHFALADRLRRGEMRPLHDPRDPED